MNHKSKNFKIVRASAGSGKTFRLVLMYLECALMYDNPRAFRRILALTFTNKAAAEMKSRILGDLKQIELGKSDKIDLLCSALNLSREEIERRALSLHKEMLHRYSDISVMTIDKFVNKLVKSFARDLALEQDYRIEIDSGKVLDDGVAQLLDKLGDPSNKELTALLKSFALSKVDDDQDSGVRKPLTNLGKTLMQEKMAWVIKLLSDIDTEDFKRKSEELRKEVRDREEAFYLLAENAIDAIENSKIESEHLDSRSNILTILRKLRYEKIVDPSKTFTKIYDREKIMVLAKAPQEIKDEAERILPEIDKVYEELLKVRPLTKEGKRHVLASNLNKNMALLGTLAALHQEVERVQVDNNIRTFHAMHARISEIVKANSAPFIYERLGARYNHIFMDEFQDTSVTQWHNLVVLYDHALSNGHKTLVVGDGKQAIYRFRNGDYKQLMDLPNLQPGDHGSALEDAERTFIREQSPETLDDNYRTGRKIVEWNNSLFEEMSNFISSNLAKVYEGLKQTPKKKFNGGVHLDFATGGNNQEREEVFTSKIIDRIKYYESLGYDLGDITILVRNNETGSNLAKALLSEGIKPMTEESLQLGKHPGPLALVALMRWILRPLDFRQSAILLQCACALADENEPLDEAALLKRFVRIEEYEKEDGTKGSKGVFDTEGLLKHLYPNLKIKDRTTGPLAGFVGHACEELGLTKNYSAYAEGLMELALQVGGTDESGLHGFLRVWDSSGKEKSIVTGKSKDAVSIMTVHKAKGLAFKIVITVVNNRINGDFKGIIPVDLSVESDLPIDAAMLGSSDIKDTLADPQRMAEVERSLLDELNVVYVAMTRPQERLDVILELVKTDFKDPKTMSELVYRSLENLGGGVLEAGDQTDDFTPMIEDEQEQELVYGNRSPRELVTGESINQLVVSPKSETDESRPEGLTPLELGSEVHRALEKIVTSSDWDEVKKSLESGYRIGEEDRATIISRVSEVLNSDETKGYFAHGLKVESEQSFVNSEGQILRPDRIVKSEEGWTVIDYKSSTEGESKHKKQVEEYCSMLSEIEGDHVEGVIIYTDPLKVLKVV